MTLEENDIVLCTVKRIEGTTVFLELDDSPGTQGTMIFSEVSPGRIRNIREFVVPNKKIVCKILRISGGHPQLSLRRVTAKEREEVMERYKKEKVLTNMIKPVVKERAKEIVEKIKEKYDVVEFLDEARENTSLIKPFVSAKEVVELEKIFASSKQDREKEVRKKLILTSTQESGLEDIKQILDCEKGAEIYYLGSSKFSVSAKAKTYKEANAALENVLETIKKRAKEKKAVVEIKEK